MARHTTDTAPPPAHLDTAPPPAPPPAPPVQTDAPPSPTQLAVPPIQLRNTYPAASPSLSVPPKLLGATPTGINQIEFPDGLPATHFQGALVSGMPTINAAAGSAALVLTVQVDHSMGNFSIPIPFPGGCFLTSISSTTYETGLLASITLGTQSGGADVAAALTLPAKGAVAAVTAPLVQLPLWDAVSPLSPFQIWLNVTGNTSATGGCILFLNYVRLAAPWSRYASTPRNP